MSLKAAIRFFCTSILLITSAEIASACPCPPIPTVLDAYEAADAVLIVRVLSVQNIQGVQPMGPTSQIPARLVTGDVERVYKGNVKVKEQFKFLQEVWCPSSFYEIGVGTDILLYLKAPKEQNHSWNVSTCGRTKPVLQAAEDLLYLDNMNKLRGKTRVSGNYGAWVKQDINIAHRRIRIVDASNKVVETFTDEKGVFEIYDLPPGKYRLEPEIPEGWRIDRSSLKHHVSSEVSQDSTKWARFVLNPQKHASVSFAFQPDNAVEGRIVGPDGKALANTCAYLRKPQEILGDIVALFRLGSLASGCSDENGRFRIESITPGSYVLVLNVLGKPRSSEPFPRVFYPGTTELEKATPVAIGLGQTVKDVNVAVPFLLDTVTVAGVLRRSDGQPVPKQEVRFESIGRPELDGLAITETDEHGRFSLKILKGLEGSVYGGMTVVAGTFTRCPELKPLNFREQDRVYVRSKDLKIETQQDMSNLVLRLHYPDCTIK